MYAAATVLVRSRSSYQCPRHPRSSPWVTPVQRQEPSVGICASPPGFLMFAAPGCRIDCSGGARSCCNIVCADVCYVCVPKAANFEPSIARPGNPVKSERREVGLGSLRTEGGGRRDGQDIPPSSDRADATKTSGRGNFAAI